jgi:hypothetical protein
MTEAVENNFVKDKSRISKGIFTKNKNKSVVVLLKLLYSMS